MSKHKVKQWTLELSSFRIIILMLMISSASIVRSSENQYSDKITVSGKVTDSQGEALIGVTIVLKDTVAHIGAITDISGNYTLNDVPPNGTLEFSSIGMTKQSIRVNGQKIINVVLKEDAIMLGEVVAVGYGTMKKSDLTGSLSSVAGKDLVKSGGSNISQALQGKSAGVYITSSSGSPGSGGVIRIRGYGSISTDLTPLYVVDGQPLNESQFNHISPQDIENIEILKDASASAIYGARGANGVVLVTTKQGKEGKMSVNFNASWGAARAIKNIDMMNSSQLYNFVSEAHMNAGQMVPENLTKLYTLDGLGKGPLDIHGNPTDINIYDTNWWDEMTRSGFRQNYNLSVSGGSEKLKSYFSFGYYTEEGIIQKTDYERFNIRVNNEFKVHKYVTLGQTLAATYVKSHDMAVSISEILLADPFTPIIAPNADRQDPNYEYNKYMGAQYSYYGNPYASLYRQKKSHTNKNIDGTVYANVNLFLKGLYFKTLLGFNSPNYYYDSFSPSFDIRKNDTPYNMSQNQESKYKLKNSAYSESKSPLIYSFQNTLSYANTFGKHDISLMAGYTWESDQDWTLNAQKAVMPSNRPEFQYVGAGTIDDIAGGGRGEKYLISYLGRLNYVFDNRYMLTANIRRDGSSKFARGNRWGTFPSFSLGWRLDQEPFFQAWNQSVISAVKLRGGWGRNGNQNIPSYAYTSTIGTNMSWIYAFNNGQNTLQGYGSKSTGNPNIRWETSEQTNIGVDLAFLSNSFTITADYYWKKTRDMLMQTPVPAMSGYQSTPWTNAGDVENRGLELTLGYRGNIGDFSYNVNTNLSFNKNKLVSTGDDKPIWGSVSKNEVGNPFGLFYGYVYDGIFQTEEEVLSHVGQDEKTVLQPNAVAGDIRFKNVNNDNALNDDDRTYIGDPNPTVIYGASLDLAYKGFDLTVYIQGVAGNDLWVQTRDMHRGTSTTNLLASAYTDAWRNPGDKTDIPRISRTDLNNNYRGSSWYVKDGSFCKIKTLQLGYNLPKSLLDKMGYIQGLRFYGSAENLLTLTKFEYMDPEVPNGSALSRGISSAQYPNPRVFTFGVNVQF